MQRSPKTLEELRLALGSSRQQDRVLAMQHLRQWVTKDKRLWPDALPIFERAVASEPDGWTSLHAIHGIETVAGPVAARAAWLSMLDRPDARTVAITASAITDPSFVPDLLALLERRRELIIRTAVLRTFGRLRVPATFPKIVEELDLPELRPSIVQALTDFGDPRAIPYLELLHDDTTDAWEEDNHGPTLRVCDVAWTAIERLRNGTGNLRPRFASSSRRQPMPFAIVPVVPTTFVGRVFAYLPIAAEAFSMVWARFSAVVPLRVNSSGVVLQSTLPQALIYALLPALGMVGGLVGLLARRDLRPASRVLLWAGFLLGGALLVVRIGA